MKRIKLKQKEIEEEKEEKYESDLEFIISNLHIDKFSLEIETCKQTELMFKASKLLTKAKDVSLRAKNRLEIIEFEMSQKMRKTPKEFDLKKDTDTIVFKAVKATEEYKRAFNAYCFARSKEEEYSLLLDNVRSRGFSLKILVELWLNNYYVDNNQYVTKKKKPIKLSEE